MKKHENLRNNKGITLVALVITIIVLLILAGVTISLTIGENGLINRSKDTADRTTKAQAKEEIEFKINEIIIEKNNKATREDIVAGVSTIEGIYADIVGDTIEGEYKDYSYTIDENNNVIMGDKLTGAKPRGRAVRMMNGAEVEEGVTLEDVAEMEIKVTGELEGGSIAEIRAINGAILNEEKSTATEKIFTAKENKIYKFLIKGDNKRSITLSCEITNIIAEKKDILTAIKEVNSSGVKKIKVNGIKDNVAQDLEIYSLDVIYFDGDLVIGDKLKVGGEEITNTKLTSSDSITWTCGAANDVGTNTVVLKVDGKLTIEAGKTLTSVAASGKGPKGMIIYCTGILDNNGTISMSSRGYTDSKQDVYLYKKKDNNSYIYVPENGGSGGNSGYDETPASKGGTANSLIGCGGRWRWLYLLQ